MAEACEGKEPLAGPVSEAPGEDRGGAGQPEEQARWKFASTDIRMRVDPGQGQGQEPKTRDKGNHRGPGQVKPSKPVRSRSTRVDTRGGSSGRGRGQAQGRDQAGGRAQGQPLGRLDQPRTKRQPQPVADSTDGAKEGPKGPQDTPGRNPGSRGPTNPGIRRLPQGEVSRQSRSLSNWLTGSPRGCTTPLRRPGDSWGREAASHPVSRPGPTPAAAKVPDPVQPSASRRAEGKPDKGKEGPEERKDVRDESPRMDQGKGKCFERERGVSTNATSETSQGGDL